LKCNSKVDQGGICQAAPQRREGGAHGEGGRSCFSADENGRVTRVTKEDGGMFYTTKGVWEGIKRKTMWP